MASDRWITFSPAFINPGPFFGLGNTLTYRAATDELPWLQRRPDMDDFTPDEIKAIRARYFLTQGQLADVLGVDLKTVRSWESGSQVPQGAAKRLLSIVMESPEALDSPLLEAHRFGWDIQTIRGVYQAGQVLIEQKNGVRITVKVPQDGLRMDAATARTMAKVLTEAADHLDRMEAEGWITRNGQLVSDKTDEDDDED